MSRAASPTDGPLVLGIETATFFGGVAVARPLQVLGELTLRSPRSHSERVMPAVGGLLESLSLTRDDLGAVAVSAGPGSFTGLRVGVAAAKGLAYALDIPLYGIPTLDLLAANALPGTGTVRSVLDARRGEVFTALYRCRGDKPGIVGKPAIMNAEEFAAALRPNTTVIGELADGFRKAAARSEGVSLAPPWLCYPRSAAAALAGAARLLDGAPSETATLTPYYLRPSDAETGKAAKEKTPQ